MAELVEQTDREVWEAITVKREAISGKSGMNSLLVIQKSIAVIEFIGDRKFRSL